MAEMNLARDILGPIAMGLKMRALRASIERQEAVKDIITKFPDPMERAEEFGRQGFPKRKRAILINEQTEDELRADRQYVADREQAMAYSTDEEGGVDQFKFISRMWDLNPSTVTQEMASRYFQQQGQMLTLQKSQLQLQDSFLEEGVQNLEFGETTEAIRSFQNAGHDIVSLTPDTHSSPEGEERKFYTVGFRGGASREMTPNDFLGLAAGGKQRYSVEMQRLASELAFARQKELLQMRAATREPAKPPKGVTPKEADRKVIRSIISEIKAKGPPGAEKWENEGWLKDSMQDQVEQSVADYAVMDQGRGLPFNDAARSMTEYLFEHRTVLRKNAGWIGINDLREFYPFTTRERMIIKQAAFLPELKGRSVVDIIKSLTQRGDIDSYAK